MFVVRRRSIPVLLAGLAAAASAGCRARNEYAPPPPPVVQVARPTTRPVPEYLEFTGTTAAVARVDLRARVNGYLQEIHVKDGSRVREGDLLFTIDPAPFRARADVATAEVSKAEAALRLAEAELSRGRGLMSRNALSNQELDVLVSTRDSASASVASAKASLRDAELQLGYTQVRAPISGRIGRRLVDVGNLVQSEQTLLATLESDAPIYVYFTISEGDLLSLRRAGGAELDGTPLGFEAQALEMGFGPEEGAFPYKGRLDFSDLGVDPRTGTLQLRGVFPNDDHQILPGLFARVRTAMGAPKPRLLVPERSLGTDQKGDFVLVVNDKDTVEYRGVKLGGTFQGMRVVVEGLGAEEWVVVNGVQRARPGSVVSPERDAAASPTAPEPAPAAATAGRAGPAPSAVADDTARGVAALEGRGSRRPAPAY